MYIFIVFYCTFLILLYIIILISEPVFIVAEIKWHRIKLHSNYLLFMPGFPLHNVLFYSNYTRIYTEKNKKYILIRFSQCDYTKSYPEIKEDWIANTPKWQQI